MQWKVKTKLGALTLFAVLAFSIFMAGALYWIYSEMVTANVEDYTLTLTATPQGLK